MRTRIEKGDIQVGVPLPCNIYDGRRKLLLRKGYVITSQSQLDALLDRGVFVIDKQVLFKRLKKYRAAAAPSPFELISNAHAYLESIYSLVGPDTKLLERIIRLGMLIQQACEHDKDAALANILIQEECRYSVKHSIHTAIACEIVLKQLGYSPNERLSALAASLTMNIAMIKLQDNLFFQREKLTEEQQKRIDAHLFEGVELLRCSGVSDRLWIDTVLQHHELLDGMGYPQGLQGKAIIEPSRVLTIADIYCAKITGRAYRTPMLPNVALKEIFCCDRGHSVDTNLVHVFIKEMGIYPPGTYVRLATGEIAIVIRAGDQADAPIVRAILRPSGTPYLTPRLRDCSARENMVKEVISPVGAKLNINRYQLWGYSD